VRSEPSNEPASTAGEEGGTTGLPTGSSWWAALIRAEGATPYRWTRFFILRLLGLLYLMGFLVLAFQGRGLIGHDGLLPADRYVARIVHHSGSAGAAFWDLPTLFYWLGTSDRMLSAMAWLGAGLSLLVLCGFANAIVLALLWALYMSFVHIGQLWYGYGWEIQLLETGFLAIFLAEPLDPGPMPARDPPRPVIWLYRWLIFRIMLGAGLIKLRGDPCWRDLTCLYTHYETQPIPNPLSPYFHALPHVIQKVSVLYNHTCELVVPFFIVGPRRVRHVAGAMLIAFQCVLILSGNLAFLNWLTIVPILACFDDSLLGRLVPRRWRELGPGSMPCGRVHRGVVWALVALIAGLSLGPVGNLLSSEQVMNTSFNAFDLVNTYGAFGTVGRERDEIVFEGTADAEPDEKATWKAYEFKCKPGDPERRPCLMSPYHYRIDWQIWFAAMTDPQGAPWTLHLVWKLLHGDRVTLGLLGNDPFPDKPPRFIRAKLYRYRFARHGESGYWHREMLGLWLTPLSVDDARLQRFLSAYGWLGAAPATEDDPPR
jgi:hypothetical protein